MIENPQPAALVLLLLALPGIVAVAAALARRIPSAKDIAMPLVPAIALALALLPVHLLGCYFGSLVYGLAIAWLTLGAIGYGLLIRRRTAISPEPAAALDDQLRRIAVATLSAVILIAPAAILYNFHDESLYTGHQALIAQLQNDVYPPRFMFAPEFALRYHYGFDLAGAILTATTRLRVDQAIDVLTLGLWAYTFILLWLAGERLVRPGAGPFVAVVTCFAAFVCHAGGHYFGQHSGNALLDTVCHIKGVWLNPPFASYFFQHPWALGTPLFLTAILLHDDIGRPADGRNPWAYVLLFICLLALFLSQMVLFTMLMLGLAATEGWRLIRNRDRRSLQVLLLLAATALVVPYLGAFLTPTPFAQRGGLFGSGFSWAPFGIVGDAVSSIRWQLASFGLLLPLGVAGLALVRRQRTLLVLLAAGSFLVLNLFVYSQSWDIAKFGMLAMLCLSIGTGALLHWWWSASARVVARAAVALGVIAVIGPGLLFVTHFAVPRDVEHRYISPYLTLAYPVDDDEAAAISFLRRQAGPPAIVFRRNPEARGYALWGGLPTAWSDEYAGAFGFDHRRVRLRRRELLTIDPDYVERLARWNVKWVVVDHNDRLLARLLDRAAATGRSQLVETFGDIQIYRLQGR